MVLDLQPTLVSCRISDVTPSTPKKSVCVENETEKCRISDMQGVRFWVEILLWKPLLRVKNFFHENLGNISTEFQPKI